MKINLLFGSRPDDTGLCLFSPHMYFICMSCLLNISGKNVAVQRQETQKIHLLLFAALQNSHSTNLETLIFDFAVLRPHDLTLSRTPGQHSRLFFPHLSCTSCFLASDVSSLPIPHPVKLKSVTLKEKLDMSSKCQQNRIINILNF